MTNSITLWLSRHSLKFKLNLNILTLVCITLFSLAFFISAYSEPLLKAQLNDSAKKSIDTYVVDFSNLTINAERVILNTKNTLSQMTETNVEAIKVLLHSAVKTVYHSGLNFVNAWLYVFPPENVAEGKLYISADLDNDNNIDFTVEQINNLYDRFPWFKEVPKKEQIYWSEPYVDKTNNKTVFTCLIPFRFFSQNDFNGLLALTIDLSDIQSNISDFSFYETGKLMLLSRKGLYVTYPDPNVALKSTIFTLADQLNLPQLKIIGDDLAAGRGGQINVPDSPVFNDTAVFFYAPIPHLGWSFLLVYAEHEFLKPIRQFQIFTALAMLVIVLLLAFIINRICHHSTKQLQALSDISVQYGRGNFAPTFADIPTSSDIGRLAGALSFMRTNLLDYISKETKQATEAQRQQSELDIAMQIQRSALSTKYPQHEAFKIATLMLPARYVGGDFYDFFFVDDNKFAIVVADVSGKGIPAALYMMKALTLIKNISRSKQSLEFVFRHVNEQLCESNDNCMFVTAFMAVIDLTTGQTDYLNAGHNPPLLGNNAGFAFLPTLKNIVLGINPNAAFREQKLQLQTGDQLFLYTDGVTEAENNKDQFYGEKRLLKIMQKAKDNPQDNITLVLQDIHKFTQERLQSDDITMLNFIFRGLWKHLLHIPADLNKLEQVLMTLKADIADYSASSTARFNMVMTAEEIFTNIASYAYRPKKQGSVDIYTTVSADTYYVTFIDNGKRYNPLNKATPDTTTALTDRDIGGWGIFLAKKCSDSMTYHYKNGHNILTIGIKLRHNE